MNTLRSLRLALPIAALFAAGVESAFAQGSIFASLSGVIRDASGATVSDASLVLVMKATNTEQRTSTGEGGRYIFTRIVPGVYDLRAEKSGFRPTTVSGLMLAVNDALTHDIKLELGSQTESVTVSGEAAGVQTRAAGVSLVVAERSVRDLPLNGKDWSKLISLAPGAGLTNTSPVSGVRNPYGSYTIDGLGNNNERSSGQPLGGGGAEYGGPNLISNEAVQEFRVITANADATFGRSSGAQVNVITKSGTNAFHGSAYEFLRNDALDARDFFNSGPFFDNQRRSVVPPLRQNLFGATIGGPIQRDRQFFFFSYEGFRQTRQVTSAFTYPNSDLIGLLPGDLGRFYRAYYLDRKLVTSTTGPGQFSPLTATDRNAAIAAGFDSRLFDGSAANGEAGTLLQSATVPQDVDQDSYLVKSERFFKNGWKVSGRFGFANPKRTGPQFSLGSPIDLSIETRDWRSVLGEVVGAISPSQVIEVRAGWLQSKTANPTPDGVGAAFRAIGVPNDLGILVTPAGTGLNSAGLLGTSAFLDNQRIPEVSALYTWQRGRLSLRSGVDIASYTIDIHNGAGRPAYTFTGFVGANGMLGTSSTQAQALATSAAASIFGVGGGPTSALRQFKSTSQEYFTQADLRLSRTLTVNLGLRYAYLATWAERDNAIANLYAVNGGGALVKDVNPFHFGRQANRMEPAGSQMYVSDKNNFQPRVGFAWDVTGDAKTAVRAAYGAYDERLFQVVFSAQGGLVNNPPFTLASNAANVLFRLGGPLPVSTGTLSIFGLDPTLRSPRTHRVSAGMERELWSSMNVTVDYVGTYGRGLTGVADVNGAAGVPQALRPDTRFSTIRLIRNTSWSDYHSLQVAVRQRMRRGLSYTLAYTLASANDDSSADTFAIFPDLVNNGASSASGFQGGGAQGWSDRPRKADWGPSGNIPRHLLVASHIIDLPFGRDRRWIASAPRVLNGIVSGWSLSGILSLRSGVPVNLTLGADANDDGDTGDRPALLSGSLSNLYASGGDKTQFLVPRDRAVQILGAPAAANDPFAVVSRNALRGPFVWYYDTSLFKRIALTSRVQLSIEANAFNIFNHAAFNPPVTTLSDVRFGRVVATATGSTPRQLQLGMKLAF